MSESDTQKFKRIVAEARNNPANVERSRQLKEVYIATKAPEYAAANGTTVKVAVERIRKQLKGQKHGQDVTLQSDFVQYIDGEPMTVLELIKQGAKFDGHYIPDPIEGPSYGLGTAVYNHNEGDAPCIVSYAHGQTTVYQLCEFERVETVTVEPKTFIPTPEICKPEQLKNKAKEHLLVGFSIRGHGAELSEHMKTVQYVLLSLAIKGQATLIYAQFNTGKTLLLMHLLSQAVNTGMIDPENIFYVNADDSYEGMVEKLLIGEEMGFHVLCPGHQGFKASDLMPAIQSMVETKSVGDTVVILDTLKKFIDPMNKRDARQFGLIMREFVAQGGTYIALAHTNKHRGPDGKPIYAGVSDPVDDADCAFILDTIETNGDHKIVEFENIKNRGKVAQRLAFQYSNLPDDSYGERLASVKEVDPNQLDALRVVNETDGDEVATIQAITHSINDGINTKMKLAAAVAESTGVSKRKVTGLIEKYTGVDPTAHKWHFVRGAKGAQMFSLLESPPDPPLA